VAVSSGRLVRLLCWALVVLVVISAITTVGLSQRLFVSAPDIPDTMDYVEQILAWRAYDAQVYGFVLVSALASLGVFLVSPMLGAALRPFAGGSGLRDLMVVLFLVGGTIGVVAQLLNIAVGELSTFGYCDCGYRPEEVIAQDYALRLGWGLQEWLNLAAITLVGIAAGVAGRLVPVSVAWSWLSYLIAAGLLVAVALRLADQWDLSDLLVGVIAGIAVTVWAVMLALAVPRMHPATAGADGRS
jgi:hypothetical protein